MMTDRAWGIDMLRRYQKFSLVPLTYSLIDHFDKKSPGLVELWGRSVRLLNQNRLDEELGKLGRKLGMTIPTRADLNEAITLAGGVDVGKAVVDGLGATVEGIGSFFKLGGLLTVIVVGGVAYYFVFTKSGRSALMELIPMAKGLKG